MAKLNFYLVKSIIVGALGGLLFGFDTAVIAGTTQQLTTVFHLTPNDLVLQIQPEEGATLRFSAKIPLTSELIRISFSVSL